MVEAPGIEPAMKEARASAARESPSELSQLKGGLFPATKWQKPFRAYAKWTRLQPIRTVAEIELEFAVFPRGTFRYRDIAAEARRMRRLGMSLRAVGAALGVDEKTVRKALERG